MKPLRAYPMSLMMTMYAACLRNLKTKCTEQIVEHLQTLIKTGRVLTTGDVWQIVGSFRNASCLSAALRIAPIQGSDTRNLTYALLDNANLLKALNQSESTYQTIAQCQASPVSVHCGFAVPGLDPSTTYHLMATYPTSFVQLSAFLYAPYIAGEPSP